MSWLVKYRWAVMLVVVVALGAMAPGMSTSMEPDHSLGVWFLDDDPNLAAYEEFQESFGNDEVVIVRVDTPDGVFETPALHKMVELGQALDEIDGVEQVHSLLSVAMAMSEEGAGRVGAPPTADDVPEDSQGLQELEELAGLHPLIDGQLIDDDALGFVLVAQMESSEAFDERRPAILDDLNRELEDALDGYQYQTGGVGVIYQALNDITERDFGIFIGLGYLVMFLLLWWVFRSVRMVLASLFVVAGGSIAALGLMGWLGLQVNMITVLLPTLIVVLGIADAMHFPVAYRRVSLENKGATKKEILAESLRAAAVPCLMTTVTTMACFFALGTSSLAGVRHLGLFAAVGVGAAFVVSVAVMAIALYGRAPDEVRELPNVRTFLDVMRRWVTDSPKVVASVLLIIIIASAVGATKINVDTFTLGFLPDDHVVVQDDITLENELGPYIPLEWTYEPVDQEVDSAQMLAMAATFATRAEADEKTGDRAIYLEAIYRFVATLAFGELDDDQTLSDEDVAELRALFSEMGGDDVDLIEQLAMIDADGNLGRITIPVGMMSASKLAATIDRLDAIADEEFGDSAEVKAAGYLPLYASVITHIVDSQIRSFGIAVVLILLAMILWLRSIRLAIISLIPNLFPVLVMLGVMGFAGIALDAVTAMVAAIVIGVAIDDTVHFLHSWRGAEKEGQDWSGCLERAFREVGPAICITTALLVGGYSVLLLAELLTVIYFGLLTLVAAAAALVGELLLLPLLLRWIPGGPKINK